MSESKFTKGPWTVEAFGSPRIVALQSDGAYMPICDIRGWGFLTGKGARGLPHEEAAAIQDANARLIAAAPDLLKALEETTAKLEKVTRWLGGLAKHAEKEAKDCRFITLKEAHEADMKNYYATAADLAPSVVKAKDILSRAKGPSA